MTEIFKDKKNIYLGAIVIAILAMFTIIILSISTSNNTNPTGTTGKNNVRVNSTDVSNNPVPTAYINPNDFKIPTSPLTSYDNKTAGYSISYSPAVTLYNSDNLNQVQFLSTFINPNDFIHYDFKPVISINCAPIDKLNSDIYWLNKNALNPTTNVVTQKSVTIGNNTYNQFRRDYLSPASGYKILYDSVIKNSTKECDIQDGNFSNPSDNIETVQYNMFLNSFKFL